MKEIDLKEEAKERYGKELEIIKNDRKWIIGNKAIYWDNHKKSIEIEVDKNPFTETELSVVIKIIQHPSGF